MRSKMSAIGTSDSAFHDGNPSTGELGTIVTADWLNAVQTSTMDLQDELLNLLSAASIANDPAVKTQILTAIKKLTQSGAATFATDTGVANAYVVSLTPALVAPRGEGQVIRFKAANTNTGASTINDGLGVVPLVGGAHANLQGGELVAGGDAEAQWNSTVGTGSYVLLSCSGGALQVKSGEKSNHATKLGDFVASVSANGYIKIPCIDAGGSRKTLLIQWGTYTVTTNATTTLAGTYENSQLVTMPLTVSSLSSLVVAPKDNPGTQIERAWYSSVTGSGFTGWVACSNPSVPVTASFIAIGYN